MNRKDFLLGFAGLTMASYVQVHQMGKLFLCFKEGPLPQGSTIALIAPGSPITKEQLNNSLQALKLLGYKTKHRDDIISRNGFLAGTDIRRKQELEAYLKDPDVDALWAVRGGYGCGRLLPILDKSLLKNNEKPILGYSDLTALINYAHDISGTTHYHCAMPKYGLSDYSASAIQSIVTNGVKKIDLNIKEKDLIHFKEVTGKICGGNLTVMTSLVGTPYEIDIEDKIVLLEDIGEKPYKIDRMLHQIDYSCNFNTAKAVLMGQFVDCNASSDSMNCRDTLFNFFSKKNIPVIFNLPVGHIDDQLCLPIGPEVSISKNQISWS